MEEPEEKTSLMGGVSDAVKEYLNLKIDQMKLKGTEHLSVLSNKVLFILLATMVGAVVLQLLGLSLSFFVADMVGNMALGFLLSGILFALVLLVLYLKRDSLFVDRLVRMYIRMFFGEQDKNGE